MQKPLNLTQVMDASVRKFLLVLHELEASETTMTSAAALPERKCCFVPVTKLAERLKDFQYKTLYDFFARLACGPLKDKLSKLEDFLSGVISCELVPVEEFFKRTAVPAKWTLDAPKGFQLAVFEQTFLLKSSGPPIAFPKGSIPCLPVSLLVEWAPLVDEILSLQEQLPMLKKAEYLGDKIKPNGERQLWNKATSDKLPRASQLLDVLLQAMERQVNRNNLLEKCDWKDKDTQSQNAFKRITGLSKGCAEALVKSLEIVVNEVSGELTSAFGSLHKGVAEIHKGNPPSTSPSTLEKLLGQTAKAVEAGPSACTDRLGDDAKAFHKAISEPASDFAYIIIGKILSLASSLQTCCDKINKAASHPCAAQVAETLNVKKVVKQFEGDLQSGKLLEASMLMADLIAAWLWESSQKITDGL